MELLSQFGLGTDPFTLNAADTAYYPAASQNRAIVEAQAKLLEEQVDLRIFGARGIGKSTVIHRIAQSLSPDMYSVVLLRSVVGRNADQIREYLQSLWGASYNDVPEGRKPVLLVDDIDSINQSVETLVPDLLTASVAIIGTSMSVGGIEIGPWDAKALARMLVQRLRSAGAQTAIFDSASMAEVVRAANGNPGMSVALSSEALWAAWSVGEDTVGAATATAVCQQGIAFATAQVAGLSSDASADVALDATPTESEDVVEESLEEEPLEESFDLDELSEDSSEEGSISDETLEDFSNLDNETTDDPVGTLSADSGETDETSESDDALDDELDALDDLMGDMDDEQPDEPDNLDAELDASFAGFDMDDEVSTEPPAADDLSDDGAVSTDELDLSALDKIASEVEGGSDLTDLDVTSDPESLDDSDDFDLDSLDDLAADFDDDDRSDSIQSESDDLDDFSDLDALATDIEDASKDDGIEPGADGIGDDDDGLDDLLGGLGEDLDSDAEAAVDTADDTGLSLDAELDALMDDAVEPSEKPQPTVEASAADNDNSFELDIDADGGDTDDLDSLLDDWNEDDNELTTIDLDDTNLSTSSEVNSNDDDAPKQDDLESELDDLLAEFEDL